LANSSLVLHLLQRVEVLLSTYRARLVFFLRTSYTVLTKALSTTVSDGQSPCYQATLLAIEVFRDILNKLTLVALGGSHASKNFERS